MSIKWVAPPQTTVLIVDDSWTNTNFLARTLEGIGCHTLVASDGFTALEIANSTPLDLILLDLIMPEIDGYEVCQLLKVQAHTQFIPIIFISALDEVADTVKAFSLGAVDFIHRPFRIPEVLARVQRQLQESHLSRTLSREKNQLAAQNQQLQQEIIGVNQSLIHIKAAESELYRKTEVLVDFSNSLKQLHRLNMAHFDSREDLFSDYIRTGCSILNFAAGAIGQVAGQTYTFLAVQSNFQNLFPGTTANLSDTFCGKVAVQQRTLAFHHVGQIDDMQCHPLYQALKLESYLGTPIWVHGQLFGTLCFFSTEPRSQGFEQHEKEIIELMAQSIGKFIGSQQTETKRQQLEFALKRSEVKLSNVLNSANAAIASTQVFADRSWAVEYRSVGYERVFGLSLEELEAHPDCWIARVLPEDLDRYLPRFFEDVFAGKSGIIEYRFHHGDGTVHWMSQNYTSHWDETANCWIATTVDTDITAAKRLEEDRKQMEQALRLIVEGTAAKTGHAFFHSLVRHLAEVLQVRHALVTEVIEPEATKARTLAFWQGNEFGQNFEYDLAGTPCEKVVAGKIVYYHNSLQALFPQDPHLAALNSQSYFGIPLNDSQGNVIGNLVVLDNQPLPQKEFSEQILRIFAARAGAELERKQAEDALSELLAQTQQQSIDLEKARDAAESANRTKGEFLANMSHELRTPLNVILGFTQIMTRETLPPDSMRHYLAIINRSGEHLLDMINDVLEMSKIEAGKLSLNAIDFDLQNLLNNLEDMFRLRAQSKGLQLVVLSGPDTPQYIKTDEGKLRQVLVNLLGNAIKFTQIGSVALHVSVLAEVDPGQPAPALSSTPLSQGRSPVMLQFEVSDTGPGIDPRELPSLFEPFVQSRSQINQTEGTGLGLPISRKFVELMQGQIEIFGQPGIGTTVTIKIPVLQVAPVKAKAPQRKHSLMKLVSDQPSYRLLVVEDHTESRRLLVTLLKSLGFEVREAANGKMAIELWQNWHPHLIWMDMHLPILDGYKATQQIRALEAEEQRSKGEAEQENLETLNEGTSTTSSPHSFLPPSLSHSPTIIIALTASAFEEDRARVLAAGCNDFVRKPFQEDLLLSKIQDYLGLQFVHAESESESDASPTALQETPDSESIQAELRRIMPDEWLERCSQAAVLGSDQQLLQLIAQIPATHSSIATCLTNLVNNFCFDPLLTLTQPPNNGS